MALSPNADRISHSTVFVNSAFALRWSFRLQPQEEGEMYELEVKKDASIWVEIRIFFYCNSWKYQRNGL